jgi:hypothetical protein
MKNDSTPTLLPRREFLVLGSAAVAAAAATSLSADFVRDILTVEDRSARLAVGFAPALDPAAPAPSFQRVISAVHLRSGDAALEGGVLVSILGLVSPKGSPQRNVAVDTMYRIPGLKESVPFLAWSQAWLGGRPTPTQSKPVIVPVGDGAPLSLGVSTSVEGQSVRAAVRLGIGRGRFEHKLRAGYYFIALANGTARPDWSSIRAVASDSSRHPVLEQLSIAGAQPVPFEYLVLRTARA